MNTKIDKVSDLFCKKYSDAILNDCAAVFVGAGMSIPCGLPSWRELLRTPLDEIGLNVDKEADLLSAAQYYTNVKNRRSDLTQHIINQFAAKNASPSKAHEILASLPIKQIWTTNYDNLIEKALNMQGKRVDVKRKPEDLCYPVPRRDVVLYKMHGDITMAGDITLISDDYESYHSRNQLFTNALKTDLATKTFLFVGFSMNDPNILNILGDMKQKLGKHIRQHFCIYKNINIKEFNDEADFKYAKKREALWVDNLKRYGIEIVRIDDYNDIDKLLKSIKRRVLSRSIFISGSAEKFEGISKEDAQLFVHNLAYSLAEKGYKIVSGFGLGIGSSVINGVLAYAYKQGQTIEGKLLTLPFPQNIIDPEERESKWKKYREDMISQAGIAIFIFGNKTIKNKLIDDEKIINAPGVRKEFVIAKEQGLTVLPIGQTGYAARELWGDVEKELDLYYPTENLKNNVKTMNDVPIDKYEKLVETIIKCVDEAQNI